jgi:hypothetical protein
MGLLEKTDALDAGVIAWFAELLEVVAERTEPQSLFSLGVVSREPALSEAEGDLRLFFKEHRRHSTSDLVI